MSARALNWAWQQSPATGSQKLVLAALADRADDEGFCYPSIRWVTVKCAPMGERTVRRCIAALVDAGFLVKVERRRRENGTLGTWIYKLTLETTSGHGWPLDEGEPVAMGGRAEPSIKNTGTDVPVQAADSSKNSGSPETPARGAKRDQLPSGSREVCTDSGQSSVEELWDACEAHVQTAPTAKSPRAAYAKLIREMVAAGWTPESVRVRAKAYRRHPTLGQTMLTLAALAKWGEELERGYVEAKRDPVADKLIEEEIYLSMDENARRMHDLVKRIQSGALVAGDAIGVPSPASSALPHAPEAGGPPPMPSPGPPAPKP